MASIITIFDYNLTVVSTCNIFIIAGGKHIYTSFDSKSWKMALLVDGVLANYAAGQKGVTDAPNVFLALENVSPGTYNYQLQWSADSAITLRGVQMMILATQK